MGVRLRRWLGEVLQALMGTLVGLALMLVGAAFVLCLLTAPSIVTLFVAAVGAGVGFMGLILFFGWGLVVLPAAIRGDY